MTKMKLIGLDEESFNHLSGLLKRYVVKISSKLTDCEVTPSQRVILHKELNKATLLVKSISNYDEINLTQVGLS